MRCCWLALEACCHWVVVSEKSHGAMATGKGILKHHLGEKLRSHLPYMNAKSLNSHWRDGQSSSGLPGPALLPPPSALPQAYVYGILDVPGVGNQILKMSPFTRGIDQKFSTGGTWQLLCLGQEDVAGHWETSNQLPESKDALLYLHQDSAILGPGDVFLPDSVQVSPGF